MQKKKFVTINRGRQSTNPRIVFNTSLKLLLLLFITLSYVINDYLTIFLHFFQYEAQYHSIQFHIFFLPRKCPNTRWILPASAIYQIFSKSSVTSVTTTTARKPNVPKNS